MNGILCIDKPQAFTSFDIVAISRRLCATRKIGHTGTLDPMATGVLVLLINRAAKMLQFLPSHNKSYIAKFKLGFESDTGDIWGKVNEIGCSLSVNDIEHELQETILPSFTGNIMQLPPMYSAVKVDGKKLYELARKGEVIERQPRPVTIESLKLIDIDKQTGEIAIDCTCSSGTYIRTLITDIGESLGTKAVMTELRRTMCCTYTLDNCITLDKAKQLSEAGLLEQYILPADSIFLQSGAQRILLDQKQQHMFCNGVRLQLSRFNGTYKQDEIICVYDKANMFIGLGKADVQNDRLKQVYLDLV